MTLVALIASALLGPLAPATVKRAPCPYYLPEVVSCYYPETKTIYWADGDPHSLAHERGHAYDDQRLTDGDRRALRPLLGFRRSAPWFAVDRLADSPGEMFADYYASCLLRQDRWRDAPLPRLRRICRFIRARPIPWQLRR